MLISSLLFLSSILCSSDSTSGRFGNSLPLDMLSSMAIFCGSASEKRSREDTVFLPSKSICLNQIDESESRMDLPSEPLDNSPIMPPGETCGDSFGRAESLEIVRSADSRRNFQHKYRTFPIYPITLNFHQSDLSELQSSPDVLSFISRAQFVVFEGPEITDLDLSNTNIEDISHLRHLTSLINLNLSNTNVTNISALANLSKLKTLDLSHTNIDDISDLKNLTSLNYLNLSDTKVYNISALKIVRRLTYLNLSNTKVSEFSYCNRKISLKTLILTNTQLKCFSKFWNMKQLRSLDLSGTNFQDLSDLYELKKLESLYLHRTNINEQQFLELPVKLPWLVVHRDVVE